MGAPHIGGVNVDVQSDLVTLTFKNREKLEVFHIRILRLQQEIILSGETVSPIRLIFQHMKALSNINKLKAFVATKMIDIIKFLEKNSKSAVYIGGYINGLIRYLGIILSPTTLTTSGQRSRHFGPSHFTNNEKLTLQLVI